MRIIIVGAGEVGFHIAEKLVTENKDVVVIDMNPAALRRVNEHLDVQTIEGSGSSPKVLEDAGIVNADIMLAVTDSDETNLIACFFANALDSNVTKVARIRNEEYTTYQDALARNILNISMVINPEIETVKSILHQIKYPGALEINAFADGRILMAGVKLVDGSPLDGVSLMSLPKLLGGLRLIIGGIVRNDTLIIPTGGDELRREDIVYFVCEKDELRQALGLFGAASKPFRNILIIGGGNIGFRLAQHLDQGQYHVKLVENNDDRSQLLSADLNRAVVLQGDGTDQELLQEENVGQMDLVIALTGDDETNVLSCLLAKRLGAGETIARVNKFPYIPVIQAIGIEHTVSTRLSAINSILHSIRRGKVISTVAIKGTGAEVMEAIAQENSDIVGMPIKDMDFPKGALILCIIRGEEVIIPTGDFIIEPLDRILILSTSAAIPRVEKALMVKLEFF
ncbi:MAG: Trk system potassium transporter TrkA [Desulfovibrio sp.]|uniref:Trk system potassium transporter TrkA n=1 Tax=Desulfovibrio sp. 7SRBS1 TaxID=3378064 RepID=UPI003B4132C2